MNLGFQRLNERTQRPNQYINFIKPRPGPTSHFAQDFLERIAAMVQPIMKANYISVMALEEYPPNPEFAGRNFNAGEVIQLVLRARGGGWLPFRSVQMVMIHELAHCKQMNHSKYFWGVRNAYAQELRELWSKGYTGDGFWGRGRTLLAREYETHRVMDPSEEPRSLCGGTFRSGGRKRKRKSDSQSRKSKESYAERQQKRIRKKFGEGGVALGDDEVARVMLEKGKIQSGKPRVAKSKRGRELRAAAALARFDQCKKDDQVKQEENGYESEDSASYTEPDDDGKDTSNQQALDADGQGMLDQEGRRMFKICEDEDKDDINVKRELDELHDLDEWKSLPHADIKPRAKSKGRSSDLAIKSEEDQAAIQTAREHGNTLQHEHDHQNADSKSHERPMISHRRLEDDRFKNQHNQPDLVHDNGANASNHRNICLICSLENEPSSLTCAACANVLDTQKLPNHWRCQSLACRGGLYVNAGDCGICGACGTPKGLAKG